MTRAGAIAFLHLGLDRSSPHNLQEQLCAGLRQAISDGSLAPATRLPSTRSLAAQLGVSRTTVVAAVLQLVEEDYLVSRERSGTFVAREPPALTIAVAEAVTAPNGSSLQLSRRFEELARAATSLTSMKPRPRAFRLSRPALDSFPVREWSRIMSRRSARVTAPQLDYGPESRELQAVIADLVSSGRGLRAQADQVLLFAGGQRALEFAVAAVLDPGQSAWMEDPGYPGARSVLRAAGASVTCVPVDQEGMVVVAGQEMAGDARLVYTTPSCQFPLGVTMSPARRQQLLAWAAQANACIVEDDYDAEFRHAGPALASLAGMDRSGRVLYMGSFSRTMFPALRIGFLVAPPALVDRLRAARATMEEQLPSLAQLALADFIAEGQYARHLRRMRVLYRARREALLSAAADAGGKLRVRPAESGLHVIADLPEGVCAAEVSAAAARRGVEAAPLSLFYADGRASPAALVLGFGAVDAKSARAAMEELAAAVDEAGYSGGGASGSVRKPASST
ncbi:MAG TPA: PLP-dependent aminotransferase family protein [Kofleriaceae bacterium]|nr:PLP-dependent aminotransferase family protein [Kofleriaceae bacterium]